MAIIIPSKNIYELENPKIRDNALERIEISVKQVKPKIDYEISAYNEEKVETYTFDSDYVANAKYFTGIDPSNTQIQWFDGVALMLKPQYAYNVAIKVPKLNNNARIDQIYPFNDGVNVSVSAKLDIGTCTIPFSFTNQNSYTIDYDNLVVDYTKEKFVSTQIKPQTEYTYDGKSATITAKLDFTTKDTTKNPTYSEDDDYYYLSFNVMSGYELLKATITYQNFVPSPGEGGFPIWFIAQGEAEKYSAIELKISVKGDVSTIDITDLIQSVGVSNTKKVFAIDGNELMQTKNYNSDTGEMTITQEFGKTLNAYKNGKETATLLCSISEYFDENGTRAISVNDMGLPMTFKMYDEVLPMVFGADGKDRPMSLHKDGSPKKFRVLGVSPHYNGAVWQKIYLQEV